MLFSLGHVVVTRYCLNYAQKHGINLIELVVRHVNGDYGDLCKADQALNDLAIQSDARVFSSYTIKSAKFYVMTGWDRSNTTVMLDEDY